MNIYSGKYPWGTGTGTYVPEKVLGEQEQGHVFLKCHFGEHFDLIPTCSPNVILGNILGNAREHFGEHDMRASTLCLIVEEVISSQRSECLHAFILR